MKYDDASWHYGGDFPEGLPEEAAATHIGMFVAWAMLNGFAGSIHTDDFPGMLATLKGRELTPGAWFLQACDGKFTDEDLNDEGNAFTRSYYADDSGLRTGAEGYLADYESTFPASDDLYSVPDSWASYDQIAPRISKRMSKWRNPKTGWRRFFS